MLPADAIPEIQTLVETGIVTPTTARITIIELFIEHVIIERELPPDSPS